MDPSLQHFRNRWFWKQSQVQSKNFRTPLGSFLKVNPGIGSGLVIFWLVPYKLHEVRRKYGLRNLLDHLLRLHKHPVLRFSTETLRLIRSFRGRMMRTPDTPIENFATEFVRL